MSNLLVDLRYAFRVLRQSPGFALIAVAALALGIGANSAIFSVLNAVLLRPLPYAGADRLVMIWEDWQRRGGPREEFTNPANLEDWREQARSFETMYAFGGAGFTLTGDGEPENLTGASVTPGLFETLGVAPALGRSFSAEEEKPGGPRALVMSYGLWQRRFGGDPNVVGKSLLLSGTPYTVAGVLPANFRLPLITTAELIVPLQAGRTGRGNSFLRVVGRLKPDATLAQARAEMNTIAARLAQQYPDANAEIGAYVVGLQEQLAGGSRTALLVLMGAVGCVLLIACANVANLLLARASARQKEIAIRIALGARRGRLIQQLLTESLLLSGVGALLGLALANLGVQALLAAAPNVLPSIFEVRVDGIAVVFTLALGLFTGVIFGIVPALQASRAGVQDALKEGGSFNTGAGRVQMRSVLAVVEMALSLVLLAGAGLLIRSFFTLLNVDAGFEARNLITMDLALPRSKYPEGNLVAEFHARFLERLKSLPGVESAATISHPPFNQGNMDMSYDVEGEPPLPPGQSQAAWVRTASPDYFATARIRLLRGRSFTDRDNAEAPRVVIVNESLAKRHWQGQDPLGKRISFGDGTWREVVGVAGNVRSFGLEREEPTAVYRPAAESPARRTSFVLRTAASPAQMGPQLRALLREMDRDLVLANLTTMERRMEGFLSQRRFTVLLLGLFAGVALVLAALGIYGVMSYSVSQRTREIGIRMALGAARGDVLRMIVGQGMALAGIGIAIGLGAALALTRFVATLLYGVSPYDPVTFAGIAAVLATVALVACAAPARRATKVDPLIALRHE